jgi:hypothetical protein
VDLKVNYTLIRDRDVPDPQSGRVTRFREVTFYLGDHGPFTERLDLAAGDPTPELARRVQLLKQSLQSLPQ